jgi:hypothetical protein
MRRRREAELGARLLREAREELVRADGKASLLLAATTVVAATVLAAILNGEWRPARLDLCAQFVWWVGVGAGCWGLVSLAVAVYPRTRRRRGVRALGVIAFFGDIAGLDADQLASALTTTARTNSSVVDQLLRISGIAMTKYRWIRMALWSFAISLLLCMGSVVFSHFL